MQTVGKRLAHIRNARGYTQSSLAKAIGVSRGVISNIEYEQNEPLPVVVNALCSELRINKEWLVDGIGPMEPDSDRSKILDELYQVCSTLSEPQQLYLLDQIKLMQKHKVLTAEQEQTQEESSRPFDGKLPSLDSRIAGANDRQGKPNPSGRGPEQSR